MERRAGAARAFETMKQRLWGGASADLCDKHIGNDENRGEKNGRIGDEDDTHNNGHQMER